MHIDHLIDQKNYRAAEELAQKGFHADPPEEILILIAKRLIVALYMQNKLEEIEEVKNCIFEEDLETLSEFIKSLKPPS